MNDLDLYECIRLTLDAVAQLAEDASRRSGSVEAQRAEKSCARARHALDVIASHAIAKMS